MERRKREVKWKTAPLPCIWREIEARFVRWFLVVVVRVWLSDFFSALKEPLPHFFPALSADRFFMFTALLWPYLLPHFFLSP